ncbi:MAG: amidohydrolase family protein [Chloroflexota bacterium]
MTDQLIPLIDTHQHLWDLSVLNLPWVEGAGILDRSYVTSDYLEATQNAGVAKAIYMEVDVASDQKVKEAQHIIAICEQEDTPTCAAVISGYPADSGFEAYIRQFASNPHIKGIRQVLHGPDTGPGYCLQPAFIQSIQLLGDLGLSFDICIRPQELSDAAKLVAACPNTQFILDHCGNADPNIINGSVQPESGEDDTYIHTKEQWMADMNTLAGYPNVVCKVSGIVARAPEGWVPNDLAPTINHCLDSFGPDRVIFGGDWPVCTLGATYEAWASGLRAVIAGRSEEDQRKLLYENAAALYNV